MQFAPGEVSFPDGNIFRLSVVLQHMYLWFITSFLSIFASDWQVTHSKLGAFTVEAPAAMQHDSMIIPTDIGEVTFHTYHTSFESEEGSFVFMVQYYQDDLLMTHQKEDSLAVDFFAATVEQSAMRLAGEVIIEDEIFYRQEFPGRFWRIHYNEGNSVMKNIAYLVKDRFYLMQVAVESKYSLHPYIDRYFESFKLHL